MAACESGEPGGQLVTLRVWLNAPHVLDVGGSHTENDGPLVPVPVSVSVREVRGGSPVFPQVRVRDTAVPWQTWLGAPGLQADQPLQDVSHGGTVWQLPGEPVGCEFLFNIQRVQ